MERLSIEAYAKVNLGLAVTARRTDGYHDIDTVFQTVSLSDLLSVEPAVGQTTLSVSGHAVPTGPDNLAFRAAELIRSRTACPPVAIGLVKRIPVAAGLGGGSSDAAAVLNGVNELYGLGLARRELEAAALELGSDVPFLVGGGTSRGRGRGEVLERLRDLSHVFFVLATPPVRVSAARGYSGARIGLTESQALIRLSCSAIQNGQTALLETSLRNDLEAGVVSCCPEVADAREALAQAGARVVVMSGSGPTVIGLVRSEAEASGVASRLEGRALEVHIARPTAEGSRIERHGS